MKRKQYKATYGEKRTRPDWVSFLLSSVIPFLPKVGPLEALKFQIPSPQVEKLFIQSFDTVAKKYRQAVKNDNFTSGLADVDYDTGKPTHLGEYPLCDKSYGELLLKLEEDGFAGVSASLKDNIISFYASGNPPACGKDGEKISRALQELKKVPVK